MRVFLAPMEGLVDGYIRELLTAVGGIDRCVTEFIRVTHGDLPPRVFYRFGPELQNGSRTRAGVPVAVQLLGSDVGQVALHAQKAVELGALQVDLNFGCPAKTVNKHKGGCVLMREPELMHALVAAVRAAVPADIPVTAKMRLGYDDRSMGIACGEALAAAGANEICIHARSKVDGYRPPAYWEEIARVRERVATPVIANGDIWSVDDYWRCREVSGCDDVMIGRGLVARPDLAVKIKASQEGRVVADMPWSGVVELLVDYCRTLQTFLEPRYATGRIKQWLNYTRRQYPEAEICWGKVKRANHPDAVCALLEASAEAWVPVKATA
ncbi:tRNA dihydrouridine synthase [Marinobacter fonticola]|uniref:tRNA dihydrouridine synthase n=1 Tax=Marinobacter fonticola TaxID=2603215 RepID=UPI0011E73EC3|nr:tRNA-dihydrouridine synthase [Marinobacter fonticola]